MIMLGYAKVSPKNTCIPLCPKDGGLTRYCSREMVGGDGTAAER
ncbi:hypothetical protein EYF80_062718 [Liparis tanakae]|uniref:Uncharacterized protein n=1 Tax=Liparis tanakae TaxID=230148 RepID=A0A4Z2EED9_9TELE|nr:hypothetical protein EYF80_062718 [Liparis tanakae]